MQQSGARTINLSGHIPAMGDKLQVAVGERVWAKMRGYPIWPALVCRALEHPAASLLPVCATAICAGDAQPRLDLNIVADLGGPRRRHCHHLLRDARAVSRLHAPACDDQTPHAEHAVTPRPCSGFMKEKELSPYQASRELHGKAGSRLPSLVANAPAEGWQGCQTGNGGKRWRV